MARRVVSVATDTTLARKKTAGGNDTTVEPTAPLQVASSLSGRRGAERAAEEKPPIRPRLGAPALDKRPRLRRGPRPHTEP